MTSDLLKPPDEMRDLVARAAHYADTDYAPFRGHGHATAVMEQLIRFADANEYPLSLTPEAWWGSSVPRLRRFYERFGFRGREGRNKMHRRPRKLRRPST